MTAPRTFTAAEVRQLARDSENGGFCAPFTDALDAFAARLQDNEDGRAALSMNDPAIMALIDRAAEKLREEGRREVLREVARATEPLMDLHIGGYGCAFCGAIGEIPFIHNPSCLWLRAQEAAKA